MKAYLMRVTMETFLAVLATQALWVLARMEPHVVPMPRMMLGSVGVWLLLFLVRFPSYQSRSPKFSRSGVL